MRTASPIKPIAIVMEFDLWYDEKRWISNAPCWTGDETTTLSRQSFYFHSAAFVCSHGESATLTVAPGLPNLKREVTKQEGC